MKIFVITSETSPTPLAEVRTDGNRVDFVVDNTEGSLPAAIKGSYDRLAQMCRGSSHLRMTEPKQATVNLLRYVMSNGDVIEITSDGRTCQLNGQLIDENAKNALFQAIRRGDLKVARKTDEPVPVVPTPPQAAQTEQEKVEIGHRSREVIQMLADMHRKQKELQETYTSQSDPEINDRDYSYSDDADFSKNLARVARYGGSRG